jgi:uncharacterized integral membrane protein
MRIVSTVIALALLMLGLLAALNATPLLELQALNLGWRTVQAPLGLLILGVAVLGLLMAGGAAALARRQQHQDVQELEHQLQEQRNLADKAEHSRFTQLQRHLDLQAQAAEHREREMLAQNSRELEQLKQALQHQLDEVGSSLAAYIGEVEDRLERHRLLRPLEPDRPPSDRH